MNKCELFQISFFRVRAGGLNFLGKRVFVNSASSLLRLLAAVDRQVCLKCPTVQMLVRHSWRRLFHGKLARSPFMPFMKVSVSVEWLHSATWLIEQSLLRKLNDFFQYEKKSTLVLVFSLSLKLNGAYLTIATVRLYEMNTLKSFSKAPFKANLCNIKKVFGLALTDYM